jgi:hypothetical protein
MVWEEPNWRMEARDVEEGQIIGPWEKKAEAETRVQDVVDGRFIISAKAVQRK